MGGSGVGVLIALGFRVSLYVEGKMFLLGGWRGPPKP